MPKYTVGMRITKEVEVEVEANSKQESLDLAKAKGVDQFISDVQNYEIGAGHLNVDAYYIG